jgi:hypothetical protein
VQWDGLPGEEHNSEREKWDTLHTHCYDRVVMP